MSEFRALDINIHYLRYFSMWPCEGQNISDKIYKLKFVIWIGITLFTSIGGTISLIRQIKGLNRFGLVDVLENLVLTLISLTYYYVCAFYMVKLKDIQKIYVDINDFSEFPKPRNFKSLNKKLIFFVKFYTYIMVLFVIIYCSFGVYEKNQCIADDIKYKRDRACGLLTQIWMPFSLKDFPLNQIFLLLEGSATGYYALSGSNIFSLLLGILENIILRIKELTCLLNQALSEQNITKKNELFKYCVRYHVNIITLTDRVNKCFNALLFTSVTIFSVIMAIISFQLTKVQSIKASGHLCAWLLTWFIVSFSGQRITDAGENFQRDLYELPWNFQSAPFQRDFMIMLLRSQKPFELWAGKFVTVSFPTFQAVLRNTYTVVTLLNMALPDFNEAYFDD